MSRSYPWPDTSSRRLDVSLVTSTLSMRREHEPHRRLSLTGLQVLHYSDGLGPVDRGGLGFASNRPAPPSIVLLNFVVLGRSYDASGFAEATLACGNARALPEFASSMADASTQTRDRARPRRQLAIQGRVSSWRHCSRTCRTSATSI